MNRSTSTRYSHGGTRALASGALPGLLLLFALQGGCAPHSLG